MPITSRILETAAADPQQLAIVGGPDEDAGVRSLTYAELVDDSATLFAAVSALHAGQTEPPTPAPETHGIPITAVSLTSAFETSRIIAGLAGFRAVSATVDPRWPLDHQVGVITCTGIGLVISDSTELAEALAAAGWTGTVITAADFRAREAAVDPADTTPPSVREASEPFLMLFSSGTTSNPKAFIKTRQQYRD
ncbi:MAG: long-chain fatty acid--CoA ligase, partial [Brevibacterium aurantiacum]|nr:long-chain fatty acid--CoA ligase [Brevibacterium aurantiacum]MDN5773163.1 long-chain fatty acid--CoA ligase [Brevibacterium aurantiacum]